LDTDLVLDFNGEIVDINLFDENGDFIVIDVRRSGLFHAISTNGFEAN